METDIYQALITFLSAESDRRGECHITCPECGHESSRKNPHCSFSPRGWKCFSCGSSGGLVGLAKMVGLPDGERRKMPERQPSPERVWSWKVRAAQILAGYEAHPNRFSLWGNHKRTSPETVKKYHFGVGVLPASKCQHERLIVPIFVGTEIVGMRGRALTCDCGKWLQAGGTTLDVLPLYGQDDLKPGSTCWIVENCVDARNIYARTGYVGLATYSVAYWRPEWLDMLIAARPAVIVVAYDNDLPGNGGAARRREFIQEWQSKNRNKIPEAAGIRRVNELLRAGLNAVLYDWKRAELHADIGGMV